MCQRTWKGTRRILVDQTSQTRLIDMLLERLNMYLHYIKKVKAEMEQKLVVDIDSVQILNDSLIELDYE